ncbi:spore germination protein [Niallia sp. Sow4_A1]|jgi:spore germination protein KA|uniref:spore germination protein n=1 Tax=Bacillaceae TaxID=186817 RepID=UPI0004E0BCB7|nr:MULTISPECIES: spore germination protein [Bacillaceae]MCM3361018.1 spore germination protein [Niallia sp. MER TA 168]CAI9385797.1 Spore germination protein B1 [Bacillus sp. T2.9-1]
METTSKDKRFTAELEKNIAIIRRELGDSIDLVKRNIFFLGNRQVSSVLFYIDGLASVEHVEKVIDAMMFEGNEFIKRNQLLISDLQTLIEQHVLMNTSFSLIEEVEKALIAILSGDSILFVDGCQKAFHIQTKGWDTRSVDEPQTEQVVRGSRDGFTESIRTNTALVRRRIRDPELRLETMSIGLRTRTDVNIAYINGVVKKGLVDEVKKRLNRIQIDGILESGYIEEMIADSPFSPFTTIMSTERPDKVASALLEGRVAIFVDNTPFVLVVPTYFWQFLQASDDYYMGFMAGSFFRIIRYIAFIISLTLTSIYVMLVSFHQEMIPTPLALTIASGREIVPFPVLLEALLMEITFELMREAGLRMPKPVGQAVSIVGSLVIGQAAVQAGIVSPFMVIVVAVTGISSFAIPNYSASYSIRLIRFPLLIASGTLGLLGFSVMFTLLAIHALSIRSFGESYLAPATPFQPNDQKDTLIRFPWWGMKKRPQLADGDTIKLGSHQKPKPPNKVKDPIEKNKDNQSESGGEENQKQETKSNMESRDNSDITGLRRWKKKTGDNKGEKRKE